MKGERSGKDFSWAEMLEIRVCRLPNMQLLTNGRQAAKERQLFTLQGRKAKSLKRTATERGREDSGQDRGKWVGHERGVPQITSASMAAANSNWHWHWH